MSTQAKNLVPGAPDTDDTVEGYESYYGALTVGSGDSFTVHIESSSSDKLVDQTVVRTYHITGDQLVITPQNASEGRRVTYERVAG